MSPDATLGRWRTGSLASYRVSRIELPTSDVFLKPFRSERECAFRSRAWAAGHGAAAVVAPQVWMTTAASLPLASADLPSCRTRIVLVAQDEGVVYQARQAEGAFLVVDEMRSKSFQQSSIPSYGIYERFSALQLAHPWAETSASRRAPLTPRAAHPELRAPMPVPRAAPVAAVLHPAASG